MLFEERITNNEIPKVYEWVPEPEDLIYTHTEKMIIAPISKYFGLKEQSLYLDSFNLKRKQAYYSIDMREHLCLYLNYFNKYFDEDQALLTAYAKIKYMIDYKIDEYDIESFKNDIRMYILSPSMFLKIDAMNSVNYTLSISSGYNTNNPTVLKYDDRHGRLLMKISILMNMIIPIMCHYMAKNSIVIVTNQDCTNFILDIFNIVSDMFIIDIESKLYETSLSTVLRNKKSNPIWDNQAIREIDHITHTSDSLESIICNLIPKLIYEKNMVKFIITSLNNMIKFSVTGNKYQLEYHPRQPNTGNVEEGQEDKMLDILAKQDQDKLLLIEYNYRYVMRSLEKRYGPFDAKEIQFYKDALSDEDGRFMINSTIHELVIAYFSKYFGDPNGIIGNVDYYIECLLILKKILLEVDNMKILPYVLTGKIIRSLNKKHLKKSKKEKFEKSQYYPLLKSKYKYDTDKIMARIDALIATVITLKVEFVSYDEPELNGQRIALNSDDLLVEELLQFFLKI